MVEDMSEKENELFHCCLRIDFTHKFAETEHWDELFTENIVNPSEDALCQMYLHHDNNCNSSYKSPQESATKHNIDKSQSKESE